LANSTSGDDRHEKSKGKLDMKKNKPKPNAGFSILELIVAMTVILICLGIVSTLIGRAFSVRARESQRTDALTSAQAALNVISREISNAGFGIYTGTSNRTASNGIIAADSNDKRIHFRANIENVGPVGGETVVSTNEAGEDITYVRYDPNDEPQTSVVINRISDVTFQYFDYVGTNSTGTAVTVPTNNTGRVRITVKVQLDAVHGQPNPLDVTFTSEVTLRNSKYMLNQY
jgi:prepilin-type N-terminal cleavage/methylation domain-containing protein